MIIPCVAMLLAGSNQCVAADAALVAHFPLDDGEGDVVRDLAGGPDGEVHGALWREYGDGHVLAFDGEDDYVKVDGEGALDLRGSMTLSAWVWPEEVPTGEVGICGKQFTSYLLTYYRDRKCWWYVGNGGNNASSPVIAGTWSHVTGTFDGSALRLYVNGELAFQRKSQFDAPPAGKHFFIGCVIGDPDASDPAYTRSGFFKGMVADVRLYPGALPAEEIAEQYAAEVRERFAPSLAEVKRLKSGPRLTRGDLALRVAPSGAMQVSTGEAFCLVGSEFSYPGEAIGWNRLGGDGDAAWRPQVWKRARAIHVTAAGEHYRLERVARLHEGRIDVEDTLTNLTDEPVGILLRHEVAGERFHANTRLGLGSDEPICFAGQQDYDVGIVVDDDLGRAYFSPFCIANRLGFRVDRFALDAGKTYTFRWSVHILLPTGEALALVNRVREQWGANHTLLGPGSFFFANSDLVDDPVRLEAYLQRRKLRIAMLSPWLDYDPGTMDHVIPRDEYKAMMQKAARAIKAADPEVKCLGSIETDWVTIYPERIPGGEKLPVATPETGPYGPTPIGAELVKVLEDADLPWVDSMKRDREGGGMLELYTRNGKPQTALGVYPAPGNYQAEFLMEQAKFICEECGLDGFYIDEFNLFWVDSHEQWDGSTAAIDPRTGEITRRYTFASVSGIGPRRDLCEYAVSNDLTMVCNTWASTLTENRLPVMRFAETWSNFDVAGLPEAAKPPFMPSLARGQLGTPIGLGILRPKEGVSSAELLMRGIVLYLRHGMVYYHYFYGDLPEDGEGAGEYGPINHMFPLTPVRLFEGGIEGEERTITCISGTYGWPHEARPTVLVFGPDGRAKDAASVVERVGEGWNVRLDIADWSDIAVIEP